MLHSTWSGRWWGLGKLARYAFFASASTNFAIAITRRWSFMIRSSFRTWPALVSFMGAVSSQRSLRQRACTALRAMADRLAAESDLARARPPLEAPNLPRATAAGFRISGGCGGSGGAWPVASCTICHASWFVSRGRFLRARAGMGTSVSRMDDLELENKPKPNHYQLYSDLPQWKTSSKVFQLDRLPACLRLRTFAPSCPFRPLRIFHCH
jgi:hypothetical protein